MSDKVFIIDFNKLVTGLLPVLLRKIKMIAWLQCLCMPVKMLYDDFMMKRSANIYTLAHNGQVCHLRKVLNDTFDPELRRIKIMDGNKYPRQYIYTNAEDQPKYLGKIYIRQVSDYADTGADFRVIVPDNIEFSTAINRIKATIDFYKLASKRYKIEYDEQD